MNAKSRLFLSFNASGEVACVVEMPLQNCCLYTCIQVLYVDFYDLINYFKLVMTM